MSTQPTKTGVAHAHQLLLYRRPLHPELFPLKARRTTSGGGFEAELWLMPAGHVLRVQTGRCCITELVTDQQSNLPAEGAITLLPCSGEREFEHEFQAEKLSYGTAVQSETLPLNLYISTFDEMVDYAEQVGAVTHAWTGEGGGRCLSVAEVGVYGNAVHAQTYHLISSGGLVVRSQTLIEPLKVRA